MKKIIHGFVIVSVAIVSTGVCAWFFLRAPQEDVVIHSVTHDAFAKTHDINEAQKIQDKENIVSDDVQDQVVQVLFGGDINFDRYLRTIASRKGYAYLLDGINLITDEYDCMIPNLEGPVTNNTSVSQDSIMGSSENYRFTFDPIALDTLIAHRTCAVNIGNNHIGNFGRDGIMQTKEYLQKKKIIYIGDTGDAQEQRARVVTVNGVRLGLVNYNAFVTDAYAHAIADLAEIVPQSDVVVVYTHWGVEYETQARAQEREIAQKFIDVGADLIIGTHPHVVQNTEEYKGKMIYYSLGNFVFDQYFQPETQQGLLVGVTYDKKSDTLSFRDHAITLQRTGQTVLTASEK